MPDTLQEPGLAIDLKRPLTREEASELLADSILTLIDQGWAFQHTSIMWRKEDYTLRRWSLSKESASLWNQYFAANVKRLTEAKNIDHSRHPRLASLISSKTKVATEVIISLTLFFCEVWKENLLHYTIKSLEKGTGTLKLIDIIRRTNTLQQTNDWRDLCRKWIEIIGPAAYNQWVHEKQEEAARKAEEAARTIEHAQLRAERENRANEARQRAKELLEQQRSLARQKAADQQAELQRLVAEKRRLELEKQIRTAALRVEYSKLLKTDYIATATQEEFRNGEDVLEKSDRRELEIQFVSRWLKDPANIVLKYEPNREQLQAVSQISRRLLVRARAGSGKTSTVVSRVVFLLRHCRVSPKTIVLFAFNKAAAQKIERDLIIALNLNELSAAEALDRLPVVQTFDAFAQAVSGLRPLERSEQQSLFQKAIELTLAEKPDQVKSAMLQFFRGEWDSVERGILPGRDAVLDARRSEGALITLGGEQVKSRGEHRIANWLFEHDIPYKYERPDKKRGIFWAPDFTLLLDDPHPLIVEYLGLLGDPAYDEKTAYKKSKIADIPEEIRPTAIWLTPESTELRSDSQMPFIAQLTTSLASRNVEPKRLTDDQIWEKIKVSAISEFRTIAIAIVGRAKQLRWSAETLKQRSQGSDVPLLLELCAEFMTIADSLNTTGRYSYAEICWQAVETLKNLPSPMKDLRSQNEKWRQVDLSAITEVIVDEYQDFSMRYNEIVNGVLHMAPQSRLFVVGDDWQAINRYAGSDARYITEWTDPEIVMSENHRSLPQIVDLGNSLMTNRGPRATPKPAHEIAKLVRLKLGELRPSELERKAVRDFTDLRPDVVAAISRLAIPHLRAGKNVAVLARTQHQVDLSKGSVKSKNPLEKLLRELAGPDSGHIDVSTVHNYKGQESDVVILLADDFPLLHPHRVIYEVFGDTEAAIREDERRLLYVGITRAKKTLYFLTDIKERSDGLERSLILNSDNWANYPAVGTHIESSDQRMIILQGWATNGFKDHLKAAGFKYSGPPHRRWERILLSSESTESGIASILAAPWFSVAALSDELTIRVLDSRDAVLAEKVFQTKASAASTNNIGILGADDLPF